MTIPDTHGGPYDRCPRCSHEMVMRQRRSDGHAFYGCTNYPACTQTLPSMTCWNEDGHADLGRYLDGLDPNE